jgi:hypothetical protein
MEFGNEKKNSHNRHRKHKKCVDYHLLVSIGVHSWFFPVQARLNSFALNDSIAADADSDFFWIIVA